MVKKEESGRLKKVSRPNSRKSKREGKKVKEKKVELGRDSIYNNSNNSNIPLPTSVYLPKIKMLFDKQKKKLDCAVGQYKGYYYFGIKHIGETQKQMKNQSYRVEEDFTFFITSDKTYIAPDEIEDIECKPLTRENDRWDISLVKDYLNFHNFADSPQEVYEEVLNQYHSYMDFRNEGDYKFLALWDLGTYFFTLFNSYPYVHIHGFKNSGKTKVMDLSSCISFNARRGSCMTTAVMFRIIESEKPTLYLDEFEILEDKKKKEEDRDVELILNAGYKKKGSVPRNEKVGNKWVPTDFNVYCPKMIANISGLADPLASRTIKIIIMRAKSNDTRANKEVDENSVEWLELRNKLYVLALDQWDVVYHLYKNFKKPDGISNRDLELWKPILVLAQFVSSELYEEVLKYTKFKMNERSVEEITGDSWENYLLDVLEKNVRENRYFGIKKEITKWLHDKYFVESEYFDNYKKEIVILYKKMKPSEKWVGNVLSKLPNINKRMVRGLTQVYLSPFIVNDLISRLQARVDPQYVKEAIKNG